MWCERVLQLMAVGMCNVCEFVCVMEIVSDDEKFVSLYCSFTRN